MTDFTEMPIRVEGSKADGVSLGRETVQIRLALKDGGKGLILNLQNVFYLSNNPSNLVSLGLLKDASVYYNDKCQALYDKIS